MFTARTRLAAERNIDQSMLRIFRQHFSYLLDPVPAMVMLSATPTARYVDATELPEGTEVYLIERGSKTTNERVFRMRTRARLRILPIQIEALDILRTKARTYRLQLRFSAAFRRNDELSELNLYVNHLDDLASSISVLHTIKTHLRSASVVFEDTRITEETKGQPCEVYYGPPEGPRTDLDRSEHPLARVRSFMHCPWQELYLNVKGIRPPRNWQSFTLILDMKDTWPPELRLTPDSFYLHVVPAVNQRQDMAKPIETNGTKERHSLRHPDETGRFVLQRLLGVYLMSKEGLLPLQPGVLGAKQESWEIVHEGRDEERRAWLALNLPDAFEQPERVAVDAVLAPAFPPRAPRGRVRRQARRSVRRRRRLGAVRVALRAGRQRVHGRSRRAPAPALDQEPAVPRHGEPRLPGLRAGRDAAAPVCPDRLGALGGDDDATPVRQEIARLQVCLRAVVRRARRVGPAPARSLVQAAARRARRVDHRRGRGADRSGEEPREDAALHLSGDGLSMATTNAIWSQIVATFAAVDRVCTEALAADLGAQKGQAEERIKSSFAEGRGYTGGEAKAESPAELQRYPRAVELAKDLAFREAHPNGADLVKMRDGMRKLLDALRKELSRTLAEHAVYSVLVPIVIYCDELARAVTRGSVQGWEPLQSETFNIENGGELFYWAIDERLRQQETHPLVLEVFYFCLNDGFVGMYQDDPRKIEEYKDRLRKHIRAKPTGTAPHKARVAPRIVGFPWRYYVAAASLTLAVYAVLRWFAYSLA